MYLLLIVAVIFVFLGWRFLKSSKETPIRQCSYGSVEAYEILKNANDYQRLKKKLSEVKTFEERYFYSVSISRLYPTESLERWVEAEPNSADALLCYGARLVQWSWDARGYGRGYEVNDD